MTTKDLTLAALPYARRALNEARPAVIEAVGGVGWFLMRPAWGLVTQARPVAAFAPDRKYRAGSHRPGPVLEKILPVLWKSAVFPEIRGIG